MASAYDYIEFCNPDITALILVLVLFSFYIFILLKKKLNSFMLLWAESRGINKSVIGFVTVSLMNGFGGNWKKDKNEFQMVTLYAHFL